MTDGRSHAAARRGMLAALLALVSAAGLYAFWLSHTPLGVGWYRDDGVYVVTAKAIAEGRGPRLDYLPGAPRMTKYPLLWPGVLAGVIVAGGADRARLTGPLVVLPNAVFLPLALLAFAAILRRSWRLPAPAVILLVLALGLNPSVLELARFPMSETFYLALTLGAIALADAGEDKPSRSRDALAAILAVAALHTRLAGAALVMALALAFAARRQFRACALTLALAAASLGAWGAWLRHAAVVDAAARAEPLFAYDLGYGGDLPGGIAGFLRAVTHDGPAGAYNAAYVALGMHAPRALLDRAAGGGSAWPLAAVVMGFATLAAAGIAARAREGATVFRRAETFYVPAALGIVLLWPEEIFRLLVPMAPWLILLPVVAAARLPRGRPAAGVAAAAVLALALAGWRHNLPPPGTFRAGDARVDTRSLERAMGAIRALPSGARIGTPMGPLVYLRTGRIAVDSWIGPRMVGPLTPGKTLRTFYLSGATPDLDRAARAVGAALDAYPHLGVHYAFSRRFPVEDFFLVAVGVIPGTRPVFRSEDYALYVLPLAPPS